MSNYKEFWTSIFWFALYVFSCLFFNMALGAFVFKGEQISFWVFIAYAFPVVILTDKLFETLRKRKAYEFVTYYYVNGSSFWNLGININLEPFHLEVHIPWGFIRFGWFYRGHLLPPANFAKESIRYRTYGYDSGWKWRWSWHLSRR